MKTQLSPFTLDQTLLEPKRTLENPVKPDELLSRSIKTEPKPCKLNNKRSFQSYWNLDVGGENPVKPSKTQ